MPEEPEIAETDETPNESQFWCSACPMMDVCSQPDGVCPWDDVHLQG